MDNGSGNGCDLVDAIESHVYLPTEKQHMKALIVQKNIIWYYVYESSISRSLGRQKFVSI
jgi:hypothetical protein